MLLVLMLYEDTRARAKTDSGTDTTIDGDDLTELIMFPRTYKSLSCKDLVSVLF